MKILIDQRLPFLLGHGGATTQIEQICQALKGEGVEVEYLRWWDANQPADLIHFFGTPSMGYLKLARLKRLPVIIHELFTGACNRTPSQLKRQGLVVRTLMKIPLGRSVKERIGWPNYAQCDHNIIGLQAEKRVLEIVYGVPSERISVVPCGMGDIFLKAGAGKRNENHLVCTGTVTERKCFVELATMARAAQVPVLFVGKPYGLTDPYWLRFKELIDGQWVKYLLHVEDPARMISLLQSARGFVLMSWFENWCLSAHEAAACGLPLLVPDQNWSRERFGNEVRFFPSIGPSKDNTRILKQFYEDAPRLAAPKAKQFSWQEVARELIKVYQQVLARAASTLPNR